jgi:hypothetical protein
LYSDVSGINNIAIGRDALYFNTATGNIAIGTGALKATTSGANNLGIGDQALFSNTEGTLNTVIGGRNTAYDNTTGSNNVVLGDLALRFNTIGSNNTCIGTNAGYDLTTGSNNTIIGNVQGTAGLANTVIIGAGATERLRIDSSGRVGIGTSGPSSQLDVRGSATDFDGLRVLNTNSGSGTQTSAAIRLGITNSFGAVNGIRNCRIQATENNTDSNDVHLDFYTNSAVGLDQETVKMRLTAGGALGIGTTSPRRRLEVSGADGLLCINATDTSTGTSQLLFGDNDDDNIGRIYYDHGTDNMAFWTNTSEKARIDTSGRLLVGTSSARANMFNATLSSAFQVEGTTHNTSSVSIVRNSNDTSTAAFVLGKSRGTAAGSSTLVDNGDTIAYLSFQGADGSQLVECASIACEVDGTPGANDMPGRLVFSTTADGASSPTERFRISSVGYLRAVGTSSTARIIPDVDNVGYLGQGSERWQAVYAVNGTIQTSDRRQKTDITEALLGSDFIKTLKPVSYKWIEGGKEPTGEIDENGDRVFISIPGQRTHWGFIAQDVKEAVDAAGIDFGGWLLDDKDDPDSQQALRYDQFIAPLTKALQEALAEIDVLKSKVAALESA